MSMLAGLRERLSVYREVRQARGDVKQGIETLLAGQERRILDLKEPFYPAEAWNAPAHLSILRLPRGYDLTIRAGKDGYGFKTVIQGKEAVIIEVTKGEVAVYNAWLKESPWKFARVLVNRVAMATSTDPAIHERYLQMRVEEQQSYERRFRDDQKFACIF